MSKRLFNPLKENDPLVLRSSKTTEWLCFHWTINDWLNICDQIQLTFRLHDRSSHNIPWENQPITRINCNLKEFYDWCQNSTKPKNPFNNFDCKNFSAYSSYNHLGKPPFSHCNQLIKSINWSAIDFGTNLGDDGSSSTLWIGSSGAATPCHYDTYGYNIVTQIIGKKIWILFPPDDAQYLYPIRIPFEESSVFSEVNIDKPDYNRHPNFSKSHPFIVILTPGDVLYVPHGWWHYVKCIDDQVDQFCISINQWLPMFNNHDSLSEGVTSLLVNSLFPFCQPPDENWLNCDDDGDLINEPLDILNLIKKLSANDPSLTKNVDKWIDYLPEKCKPIKESNIEQLENYFQTSTGQDNQSKSESPSSVQTTESKKSREITSKDIIKCILKPNVIEQIVKNISEEMKSSFYSS